MQPPKPKKRRKAILLRTALLAWLLTIVTLLIFALVNVPEQRKTFLGNLESKARGVSVSLQDVTAGAVVTEDYSSVVDHCLELLSGDDSISYLVITRNDGFSLIHEQGGWRSGNLNVQWHPDERAAHGGIATAPIFDRRVGTKRPPEDNPNPEVYKYSWPLDYSGIQWGWIHVGLSLDFYYRSVTSVYWRTGLLAIVCILFALIASMIYARKLVSPILSLQKTVREVASGDLSVRAEVHSGDEVESLAHAFNSMTEALLFRDSVLESVRFAAEEFLSADSWENVIEAVLEKIGQATDVDRVYIWQNGTDSDGDDSVRIEFEWIAGGIEAHAEEITLFYQGARVKEFESWGEALDAGSVVKANSDELAPLIEDRFIPPDTKALILVPINVSGKIWGGIGLDACQIDREWSESVVNSIMAAANTLGSAIERRITNEALVKAKNLAENASRAKSQFLANMSHEIRTPIAGLMGMLNLLSGTELNPKQKRYVNNTINSADALLSVIGDILDFSKIEAGKLQLEETEPSVVNLVDRVVRLFAEETEEKGIELTYLISNTVPSTLLGDPNRLRQILVNLINNAVKFTDTGEIMVTCNCRTVAPDETELRFEVTDSGCGLEASQQHEIFDAFTQTDSSMHRQHGGTGLGLAISRQLCGLMGGAIGVESTAGKGSKFWFTVLAKDAQTQQVDQNVSLSRLRVLIIDDSPNTRAILGTYLASWNAQYDGAENAAVGLELLHQARRADNPFDVVLVDAQLPGMNWKDLGSAVTQIPGLGKTNLVLMAGLSGVDEGDLIKAGYGGWTSKPIRKTDVFATIKQTVLGSEFIPRSASPSAEPDLGAIEQERGNAFILIAEDNEINRTFMEEMITSLGYRCACAENGNDAVRLAKSGAFNLVIMDCQMPHMDGYEATREIRAWESKQANAHPQTPLPIIALTAHAIKGDRERCLEAGMDDYLAKPVDPGRLESTIKTWLLTNRTPIQKGSDAGVSEEEFIQSDKSPINYSALLGRCRGKATLAHRLIRKFVTQGENDLRTLEEAIEGEDNEVFSNTVHRLKGAAAIVSADTIRDQAATLEHRDVRLIAYDARAGVAAMRNNLEGLRRILPALS